MTNMMVKYEHEIAPAVDRKLNSGAGFMYVAPSCWIHMCKYKLKSARLGFVHKGVAQYTLAYAVFKVWDGVGDNCVLPLRHLHLTHCIRLHIM